MRKTQAAYDAEKVAALAVLERAFGRGATIPHDLAAAVLPVLPEWSVPARAARASMRLTQRPLTPRGDAGQGAG